MSDLGYVGQVGEAVLFIVLKFWNFNSELRRRKTHVY